MTKDTQNGSSLNLPLVLGGGAVVVAVVAGGFVLLNNQNQGEPEVPAGDIEITSEAQDAILDAVGAEDGEYYAEASFYVDAAELTKSIGVKVTIADGKIVSASVSQLEGGEPVDSEYMDDFNEVLEEKVVGKTIADVQEMEEIKSGSTLTANGFKEALGNIEKQGM